MAVMAWSEKSGCLQVSCNDNVAVQLQQQAFVPLRETADRCC